MSEKFSDGVNQWESKLGLIRDAVRQELVTRQLNEQLPPASEDIRILDVGSGQGTQANRLANLGYKVTGIEPSEELLKIAIADSQAAPNAALYLNGTLGNIPDDAGQDFDVVCCHGVLMYLPELGPAIQKLTKLVRPGGLISVLTRNRASIAMRAGMSKNWQDALQGFDAMHYKNRLGIEDVRADEPQEVIKALEDNNAKLLRWYGVRLFTDHWGDQPITNDFDLSVDAEFEAGKRDPYRQLTSLTHVIARLALSSSHK